MKATSILNNTLDALGKKNRHVVFILSNFTHVNLQFLTNIFLRGRFF